MKEESTTPNPENLPPAHHLFNLATGFMKSQAIYVAAKLGLADLLRDGPRTTCELAGLTGSDENSLGRLLRALASIGIFAEKSKHVFELTSPAHALRSDVPMSLRPYALLLGDISWWHSWGNLLYSVKTGDSAFDHMFKMSYSEYLEKNPELSRVFIECMSSLSQAHNSAVLNSYDFSRFQKLIDVGGGPGTLLATILGKYPEMNGVLFDRPHVIHSNIKFNPLTQDRVKMIAGDFFQAIPTGGDLYLLKQIIHDWEDRQAVKILKNCRRAMKKTSRILVIEAVMKQNNFQSINHFFNLHMLVTAPGAKERDEAEFTALFESAGLKLLEVIQTPSSYCLIEGAKQ